MGRLIIFDFDGTITDAEQEGVPFREGYLEDLAVLTGRDLPEIQEMASSFEKDIAKNKQRYGWMYGKRIVAPASVDPYLRIMPVARKIFDACGAFPDDAERSRLLDGILYKYNYLKTATAFRPGALELLTALHESPHTEIYVVTNSHTDAVARKIELLGRHGSGNRLGWLLERVQGRARKYIIEDDYTVVEESVLLPSLERPVLLRRAHYGAALETLRTRHQVRWEDTWVIGDIFELDLALPLRLGANVVLVTNEHTPDYEITYLEKHPRGRWVRNLDDVRLLLTGAG